MDSNYNIKGKYGCWWEGGTGVSPEGNQCGECYPQWEDICPYLKKHKEIEELIDIINDVDDNGYAYDEDGYEITGYANSRKIAEALYNADYRKQSENVIELPCKVGAKIWYIDKNYTVQKAEVTSISIRTTSRHIIATRYVWETEETIKLALMFERLNVDYWLTKEEAENVLAKMKGGAE